MHIRYHGHSCIQLTDGAHSVLVDPFISGNPHAATKAEDIQVGHILLTHGHDDHITDAVFVAKRNNAPIVAVEELAEFMAGQGVSAEPMHVGGKWTFPFGRLYLTQATHTSSVRAPDGQRIYAGVPVGFIVEMGGKVVYHAGDTGLFGDMRQLGERFDIDVAFLPIGGRFTMGPEEALLAAEWLRARHVVPIHYDTFPPIRQDGEGFVRRLNDMGMKGTAMKPGSELTIN
ncbi:L-ascorbate metabolism protein UlaG, beta-lactamase superfamily [Cohnella sp. OV330]|uniref:metal-dependent hydrolase n=1 Tax=Cohnella sp. OV330 TaxID=1855288 RepID=UPI0008E6C65D|nr:metal-dependent hydrolase [Cohnella sp. OV330]SFB49818.1 L-ascorbate metabolism protein UlaG, beta-lactamase superfamily [Cohnella sp. OV330]